MAAYLDTVHFTSSDVAAGLPVDYPFKSSDAGTHTFSNLTTFCTAGSQTITATDTQDPATTGQATVTVAPAAAAFFSVTGPATISDPNDANYVYDLGQPSSTTAGNTAPFP